MRSLGHTEAGGVRCSARCGSRRTQVHCNRRLQSSRYVKSVGKVKAQAIDLEEIDPVTGQALAASAVSSPLPPDRLTAGGLTWAYRKTSTDAAENKPSAPDVLLLHGIGSSSYTFRTTLTLLEQSGFTAYAPDWIGHGSSDKPPTSKFDYSEGAYLKALEEFVEAAGIKKPYAVVVQGFILGQYGLLHALNHAEDINRLMILNTPVGLKTGLRPELAAYKNPLAFLRPKGKFDGLTYNITGSPYAWREVDARVYGRPYEEEPEASTAVAATVDRVDFGQLLKKVDQGYLSWRQPSLLLFGSNDPFIDVNSGFDFLDSKRTTMRMLTVPAKVGHMPQEDYPEALHEVMTRFLTGEADTWDATTLLKMTKKGVARG